MVRDQGVGGSNPLSPTNLSLTVSITYTAFAAFDFAPELLGEVCRRMSGVRYVFVGDAELEWSIEVDRGMPPVSRNRQLSAEVKAARGSPPAVARFRAPDFPGHLVSRHRWE